MNDPPKMCFCLEFWCIGSTLRDKPLNSLTSIIKSTSATDSFPKSKKQREFSMPIMRSSKPTDLWVEASAFRTNYRKMLKLETTKLPWTISVFAMQMCEHGGSRDFIDSRCVATHTESHATRDVLSTPADEHQRLLLHVMAIHADDTADTVRYINWLEPSPTDVMPSHRKRSCEPVGIIADVSVWYADLHNAPDSGAILSPESRVLSLNPADRFEG